MALEDKIDALIVALDKHTAALKASQVVQTSAPTVLAHDTVDPEATTQEVVAETQEQKKRGRPRKVDPVPPQDEPDPEPEPAAPSAQDLVDAVQRGIKELGAATMKSIVAKYGVSRSADIPEKSRAAFIAQVDAAIAAPPEEDEV